MCVRVFSRKSFGLCDPGLASSDTGNKGRCYRKEAVNAVTGVETTHSLHLIALLQREREKQKESEKEKERKRFLRRIRLSQRYWNNRRQEMQKCDAGWGNQRYFKRAEGRKDYEKAEICSKKYCIFKPHRCTSYVKAVPKERHHNYTVSSTPCFGQI